MNVDFDSLPDVLTAAEVAEVLRVSQGHVSRLAKDPSTLVGQARIHGLGRRLIFSKARLGRMLLRDIPPAEGGP